MGKHKDDTGSGPQPGQEPPAPGPTDQGGKGGMATREVAPDIAEPSPDQKQRD
ncbi:hypothetical protein [[Mycobacterium] wendilense]|uniref:Uncharacterized protein n=1 Tax=[Mycobacterium] wendilense TaxID=3064284 RepID=A0ABN9P112_9MYCO|nr:hypothetical protein [Mycolicibacterium sp. MU0050]CAJ1582809.1 hypothetical protein MU0050_002291 [Mycolicibacterium sp. MU0050]